MNKTVNWETTSIQSAHHTTEHTHTADIEHAWSRDHATRLVTAVLPLPGQRCETVCLNSFGNRTSPSDNSNDRWNICLVSWAAVPCVWMLRALTRNLLTYLHTHSNPTAAYLWGQMTNNITHTLYTITTLITAPHHDSRLAATCNQEIGRNKLNVVIIMPESPRSRPLITIQIMYQLSPADHTRRKPVSLLLQIPL